MVTRTKSVRISRKISPVIRRPIRSFALATGELLWASNDAHAAFAMVFVVLVSKQNMNVGWSIWNTLRSDSTQRQIFAAAVESTLGMAPRMRNGLLWAKEQADRLAEIRNDAAPMATAFRTDGVAYELQISPVGNPQGGVRRLERISDLNKRFRTAKSDLVQLAGFVRSLMFRLVVPDGTYPWPRRPLLPAESISTKRKRLARTQVSNGETKG